MYFPTFRAWLARARRGVVWFAETSPRVARGLADRAGRSRRWLGVVFGPRRKLRWLVSAPLLGVWYMLLLLALSMSEPLVPADETLLGKSAKDISSFVAVRFAKEIRTIGLDLALTALACGLALGAAALALAAIRNAVQGVRRPLVGFGTGLSSVVVVALLHAFAVFASMARWPQLYSHAFYSHEGLRASLQVFVTDRLGPRGVSIAFIALLVAFMVGAPRRWRGIALRARDVLFAPASTASRTTFRPLSIGVIAVASVAAYVVMAERPTDAAPIAKARADAKRRPNVLVIASDGMRVDRLTPRVAPRLSALADKGTRFDRAYASLPRTLSSWTTMMTGRFAYHHGVRSGFPRPEEVGAVHDTLPSRMRAAGYRTAVISDYAGDVFRKVEFGFDLTHTPAWDFASVLWQRAIQRSTPLLPLVQTRLGRSLFPEIRDMSIAADPTFVSADAVNVLRSVRDEPFFMVVFFSTTHFPYAAPAPYFSRFTDPAYDGVFRYDKQVKANPQALRSSADIEQIRGLYDGAVAAVDASAGLIFDELDRQGLAEDTIVVITADHGETLFEHERWHGHGAHLFGDEGTHIPLAIYDPRAPRAQRVDAVVSNVDFAPTLADLAGVDGPAAMDGRSLAPAVRGEALAPRLAFAETELWLGTDPSLPEDLHLPTPPLFELLELDDAHGSSVMVRSGALVDNLVARHRMVRDERFKLLYMPTPTGIAWRLYDTIADPEELVDVQAANPAAFSHLRSSLFAWLSRDPALRIEGERLVGRAR